MGPNQTSTTRSSGAKTGEHTQKLDFDRLERFFDELPTPIDHVLVTYRDATSAPMWLAEPLALNHPGRTVTVATVAGASIAQYREAGQGGI